MDQRKREVVRDVIRSLHRGLPVEEARRRIEQEAGTMSSAEIAEIEQSLIDEGMAPEEIQRFCDVHVLLFESALRAAGTGPATAASPLERLRNDNRELGKAVAELRAAATPAEARAALGKLRLVREHYTLKENGVFPLLERHGFPGPSQVMWAKHDEVRALLDRAEAALAGDGEPAAHRAALLEPLAAGIEGMIQKEETILLPAAIERISPEEWATIGKSFAEMSGAAASGAQPAAVEGAVSLPSGRFAPGELAAVLNRLPVEISFVGADDSVRYFNQTPDRIFPRAVSVIGRKVQNCHPSRSVDRVNGILRSFREGTRDQADFWIDMGGKFVSIRYFAVRDDSGTYLGCLEVSQDLTELRALQGERRLLDDAGKSGSAA
jgi:DUF438 domain-containing protein